MKNTLKRAKDRTVKFVNDHEVGCVYTAYAAYVVACFVGGYVIQKKINEHQQAAFDYAVSQETLRIGVASGHKYRYEPDTDTLWDITLRPDKAG